MMSEADPEAPTRMTRQVQTSTLPPPVVVTTSRASRDSSQRDTGSGGHRSSRRGHRHRSRSSGRRSRSRPRHSSRHESPRSCRIYCKRSERNFSASACSMVSIVLLCTALEPEWISLTGGRCHEVYEAPGSLKSLSTTLFFYNGHFYKEYALTEQGDTVYKFGPGSNNFLVNCVTYSSVLLFKSCIAFTFIAVVSSFTAFLLDLIGPKYPLLWILRRHAVFNIVTVVLCIVTNLFTYWIASSVDALQRQHLLHEGSKVTVTYGVSFYLVSCAGVMSVMATACNCLQKRPPHPHGETCSRAHTYTDDTEALLSALSPQEDNAGTTPAELSPPPAYTP